MAESGIDSRIGEMELGLRLGSAFDWYSVACEAFSEHRLRLIPVN